MLANVIGEPASIDDVIAALRAIDKLLPDGDGVKWFNFLYLKITEAVQADRPIVQDWEFLERFDVRFAQRYFDAIVDWERGGSETPHAWRPLFRARRDRALSRVQFAFAGMNAHINHDLALALDSMAASDGGYPPRDSPRYRDFRHVNDILERAESQLRPLLAVGLLGEIDSALGNLDSLLVMFKIRKAREAAWTHGEVLWHLREAPHLKREYLARLDQMTALVGKGLLVPRHGVGV